MRAFGCLMVWVPLVAQADPPLQLAHQGRLLDGLGQPISGPTDVAVTLYDTSTSTPGLWSKSYGAVPVEDGYYAVSLVLDDGGQPLNPAHFADGDVWVGVSVAGAPVGVRQRLASVPFALVAGSSGGGITNTTSATCTTPGQVAWNTATEALVVCHGGAFQVVASFGTHVVIADMVFPDAASVAAQGWTCNHASPFSPTVEGHMHLHNNGGPTCSKDVTGLQPNREYSLSFRRFSNGERLTVYALDGAGAVTATLHQKYYATGDSLFAEALFASPASGRIRILFDDPDNNDGGASHIDLRSVPTLTSPHVALVDRTFANVAEVFQAGWDANHTGAFSTTGENHIHIHNFSGAFARRNFRVVPNAPYTLTFKRWTTGGRMRVHAVEKSTNNVTSTLATGSYGSSNGEVTTLTFTGPASGWVQVEGDSPSVLDFGFNHVTLTSP